MDREDKFVWHERKATQNYTKHGISFEEAKGVFRDTFAVEKLDDRYDYGEERSIRIGIVGGKILVVAYTERDRCLRLISARKANRGEQDEYYRKKATRR